MKVSVRYFASVKEALGKEVEEVDLPPGVATVSALRAHLRARGAAYGEVLAEKRLVKAAVNQDMVPPTAAFKAGDEIAFFPPVTGG